MPLGGAEFELEPRTERGTAGEPSPEASERGEVYDAVDTDDLGAEWLARATESLPARQPPLHEPELVFTQVEGERISEAELIEPYVDLEPEETLDRTLLGQPDREDSAATSPSPQGESAKPNAKRPRRRPPRVFDVADLPQEQDARPDKKRNI